ncbi:MAG: VWA domain-containing protein, partial [Myxococcota bacterium]
GWEWRWPTVVGPRYLGGSTPDPERVTVPVADAPLPVTCEVALSVGDPRTGPVRSPSHPLGPDGVTIVGGLDRDVVVRWPVAPPTPGITFECARPEGDPDAYGWLTIVPPAAPGAPVTRDLCLLLDVSGSMGGAPLTQLRAVCAALVDGLRAGDQLEMIAFASSPSRWRTAPVRIDAQTRAEAHQWLAALSAGGGTAMHDAVVAALAPVRAGAARQVVLMTDGYIGFESQVIREVRSRLPSGSTLHVLGVGSSVNRTLTAGAARAGAGVEAIVGIDEPVHEVVRALLARTGDPLWVGVSIDGVREAAPRAIGGLLAGCPARVAVRLDPRGGPVTVTARTAGGVERHTVHLGPIEGGRRVLATRYAREVIEDLELDAACGEDVDRRIEALGLQHRLATRLTSWVVTTERPTVDAGDPTRRVEIPHALPYGVSAEGVGLRGVAVAQEALGATRDVVRRSAPRSAPRPAPAPSGAPARMQKKEKREVREERPSFAVPSDKLAELDAAPTGAPPPASEAAPEPAVRVLRARLVSTAAGLWVIEVTFDADTPWDPAAAVAVTDSGRAPLTPLNGTTRAGSMAAGTSARLVLAATGPAPTRIELPGLHLVLGS